MSGRLTHLREPVSDPGGRVGRRETRVKFGNFLFPDSRDPERDGAVIDETLREAWLSTNSASM